MPHFVQVQLGRFCRLYPTDPFTIFEASRSGDKFYVVQERLARDLEVQSCERVGQVLQAYGRCGYIILRS